MSHEASTNRFCEMMNNAIHNVYCNESYSCIVRNEFNNVLRFAIASISKDNKVSSSNADHIHAISLFNSICKVFDYVVLYPAGLHASDIQSGHREDHFTTLCAQMYRLMVNYKLNTDGIVYSCVLNASKTYDCVHYGTLFKILLSKLLPSVV